MKAFISYDFDDRADHQNLVDRFEDKGIPYWDPKTMLPGKSLRDQIREGIRECAVCVFLATERSIQSRWCLAEVGAFWGLGKPVVMFTSGITKEDIPKQFEGDLTTAIFNDVVRAVKAELFAAQQRQTERDAARPRLVSEMTVATLYDVLVSLKNGNVTRPVREVCRLIYDNITENAADSEVAVTPLLQGLINVNREAMQAHAVRFWPATFTLKTETGTWLGFAQSSISHPGYDGYNNCLVARFDDSGCVAATVVSAILERDRIVRCEGRIASAGDLRLGEIISLLRTGHRVG